MKSQSEIKRSLQSKQRWINEVLAALDGDTVRWAMESRKQATATLAAFGLTICTKTWAEKRGYTLKPKAKPIGTGYFGAPISNDGTLYILECHFTPPEDEQETEEENVGI